jgi:hypothetical protein
MGRSAWSPARCPAACAGFMIADAVRYMSVDSCRDPDSAGIRCTSHPANSAPLDPENTQARGRFRWWWQVLWWQVLGSNQRRLSRRFYRPLIIETVYPLRVSPYGGSSDTTSGSAAQPIPVPSCTGCGNDNHGRGHRAKICTPRSPRGQHGSSTALGNDGNQPGTTGKAPSRGPDDRPADPPAWARRHPGSGALTSGTADPPRYFSSCRAMTTRWIWLVPS